MKIETPRGILIKTENGEVELVWNPAFVDVWEGRYHDGQVFVDNEVLRLNAKYIPHQTGFLNQSGILGTIPGSGKVVYNAPYARYMYYGKVMRDDNGRAFYGKAPKHVTEEEISYQGAPQRGKLWFERMKQAHKAQILKGLAEFMK